MRISLIHIACHSKHLIFLGHNIEGRVRTFLLHFKASRLVKGTVGLFISREIARFLVFLHLEAHMKRLAFSSLLSIRGLIIFNFCNRVHIN